MDRQLTEHLKQEFDKTRARCKRKEHPEGFPTLPEIPTGRYTDEEFFQLEQEHVWPKVWLFAGHVDEIPEKGSYKLWRDSGVPIVLVRGEDDVIYGHYNVCSHRGGPLVSEKTGSTDRFRCQYHCWTYNLKGDLSFVPDEYEFPDLDKCSMGLTPVRVELWGNWIYVNRDMDAVSLMDYLGRMVGEMADFHPEKLHLRETHNFTIRSNWKLIFAAFVEAYHLKMIHPNTAAQVVDSHAFAGRQYINGHSLTAVGNFEGMNIDMVRNGLTQEEADALAEATPELEITRVGAINWSSFPNVITLGTGGYLPSIVIWPIDVNHSRIEMWWFGPKEGEAGDPEAEAEKILFQRALEAMDVIIREDVDNLVYLQESMESKALESIRLGHQERLIYHHEEKVESLIGEHMPKEYSIPRVLEQFIVY